MCADPRRILAKIYGHVGSEVRVPDATQPSETPEAVDPEREKQVQADEAARTAVDAEAHQGELP